MKIYQHIKTATLLSSLILTVGLAACSGHANPLLTANSEDVGKFLLAASQFSEKKLGVFNAPGGRYYGKCMEEKEKPSLCAVLYKNMVHYAESTVYFKHITVNDLSNLDAYEKVKEDYEREEFDAI